MKNKTRGFSILIYSVFIALACLFVSIISSTNAWFSTDLRKGMFFELNVGSLDVNLYQDEVGPLNLLKPTSMQLSKGEYDLTNSPELKLILCNTVSGSQDMYARFSFQVYALQWGKEILLDVTVKGSEFEKNDDDGKFYSSDKILTSEEEGYVLLTGFTINGVAEGSATIRGGESLKVVLTIEGSLESDEDLRWV